MTPIHIIARKEDIRHVRSILYPPPPLWRRAMWWAALAGSLLIAVTAIAYAEGLYAGVIQ